MKRGTLIAVLTAIMIMACSALSFAADGLELVSSYPEDGQKNTSMENLGVKLTFNHPINSEEAKKIDASKFSITDEDGEAVPVQVLFSEKNDGLVLVVADVDKGFVAKNNSEYTLKIDAGLVDNDGNELAKDQTITFSATAQESGKEMSEVSVQLTIPKQETPSETSEITLSPYNFNVPHNTLDSYGDEGYAKLVIALARGKKVFDKRATIKEKDIRREMERVD